MLRDDILGTYVRLGSQKKTAKVLGISHGVVRKTLIDEGMYTTPLIEDIAKLLDKGLSQKDIALVLGISEAWVSANAPYSRLCYLERAKSKNAKAIKRSRSRKAKKNA